MCVWGGGASISIFISCLAEVEKRTWTCIALGEETEGRKRGQEMFLLLFVGWQC